ncbi:MAG: hypothetical protein KF752_02440 [Pirellulaceae bacterium]|nr:hypothetical protein [Pirellulaceae bacterium]
MFVPISQTGMDVAEFPPKCTSQSNPSVPEPATRTSILVKYYHRYLSDGDTPRLIVAIARRFLPSTLQRLLTDGGVQERRAAALAIGLLGDNSDVSFLGPLLRSNDRRLRLVADDSLRAIAAREGSAEQRQILERVIRYNECGHYANAIELASGVIDSTGGTAEFFHQRSLALFQLDSLDSAVADCLQVLKLNTYHYAAMVGLGHCYLERRDLVKSLHWFRQALDVYPDLEPVRMQIRRLQRDIQEL